MSEVDVEHMLTDMTSKYSHPVNWRYSIVDLMSMLVNVWLHKSGYAEARRERWKGPGGFAELDYSDATNSTSVAPFSTALPTSA